MRTRSRAGEALAVLLCCALAAPPGAHAATPEELQEARSFALQGQREFSLGNYEAALNLMERSFKIHPLPALLYNVAQCHRLLGHLEQARRVYKAFIDSAPEGSLATTAREKLAEVEAALKAQAAAQKSQPENLARTSTPAEDQAGLGPAGAPTAMPRPPAGKGPAAPSSSPPGAAAAPAVALGASKAPEAKGESSTWPWWVAGAVVVAGGAAAAVLLTSSKTVNEPVGTFNGR